MSTTDEMPEESTDPEAPANWPSTTKLPGVTHGEKKNPTPVFHPFAPIADLRPADYNPRFLEDGAFERLKASINKWGIIKPVILNGDGTLLAGHQRIKSLQAIGWNSCPAVQLDTHADMNSEVLFNLLHNRVETDASIVTVPPGECRDEWEWIAWEDIVPVERKNAFFCSEIGKMAAFHGAWGSAVINESGHVLVNCDYAVVCYDLHLPMLVWRVRDEDSEQVVKDLGGDYGVYEWSKLNVQGWEQFMIQPKRLRQGVTKRTTGSTTWDQFIIPTIEKDARIVDFGAGHMDYVKALSKDGYKVLGYEPFYVTRGVVKLDIPSIVKHIYALERELRRGGLFDVVVLDSVINGTTSKDYQNWVLTCCNALMRPDGRLVFGTRRLDYELDQEKVKRARGDTTRRPSFLDADNVEVSFQQGLWVTMRYHTQDTLRPVLEQFFHEVEFFERRAAANFWGTCRKPKVLDPEEYRVAIDEEFNMPYVDGYKHDRHGKLLETLMGLVAERNAALAG